jgi:hypothetical protein
MSSIFDTVTQQLAGGNLSQLSQHIGADEATTQQAVQAAIPMLLGGLARNASDPNGAASLSSALGDHADGSALSNLGGLLGGGGAGAGILGHIFGNRRNTVEQGVGQATGLQGAQVGKLLMVLAPIVMAALARRQQAQPNTADQAALPGNAGALPEVLNREAQEAQQRVPGALGGLIGMLDRDGDGNPLNDLGRMMGGKGGLGGMLGG